MTNLKTNMHIQDTSRWHRFKKEMCASCEACCCYLPVEVDAEDLVSMGLVDNFFLEFSEKEQNKEALRLPQILRYQGKNKKYLLDQRSDGSCLYLNKEKKCDIYGQRPKTCRNHPQIGPRPGYCPYLTKKLKNQ